MAQLLFHYSPEQFAIVLAGGDGARLRSLTRKLSGYEVPKQFCPIMGSKTLLEETFDRVSVLFDSKRTFTVLTQTHECFYAPFVERLSTNAIVQPRNRGTAPAILYALLRIAEIAPASAVVALFPSDHYVSDARAFMRHVGAACRVVENRPEFTVLLGISPSGPEQSYGWIEPGERVWNEFPVHRVRRFFEKPEAELAAKLWRAGALWNSFVIVGRVSTLIATFMVALPRLYAAFHSVGPVLGTPFEQSAMERLYADLGSFNYSAQVLEKSPVHLAVLPVSGVEWSDLGDPNRVIETWARAGVRPSQVA